MMIDKDIERVACLVELVLMGLLSFSLLLLVLVVTFVHRSSLWVSGVFVVMTCLAVVCLVDRWKEYQELREEE